MKSIKSKPVNLKKYMRVRWIRDDRPSHKLIHEGTIIYMSKNKLFILIENSSSRIMINEIVVCYLPISCGEQLFQVETNLRIIY